ncbi:hypothetical protein CAP38_10110 [Hydrogenophaga sp. IBVHS2]|nr:hypothetical protein CAP38_10110 [Hydrogenophaga sp. IBVHS2]
MLCEVSDFAYGGMPVLPAEPWLALVQRQCGHAGGARCQHLLVQPVGHLRAVALGLQLRGQETLEIDGGAGRVALVQEPVVHHVRVETQIVGQALRHNLGV